MTTQEQKSPSEVFNAICPVCPGESVSNYVYKMQDSKTKIISYWNRCRCGVVWQHKYPEGVKQFYGKGYIDALVEDKEKYADSCYYYARVYAPIIEEMMFGRKLLDIGYTSPYNMDGFRVRGWVPYGIEVNDLASESARLVKGDFETHEFGGEEKFNLIWMNHVLENFRDPVKALAKARDLLNEDGIIFIATPDTDMIMTNSQAAFVYWREKEHYIMWNRQALTKKLEELGFEVILSRRNHEARFTYTDNIHIIAQKRFF